MPDHDDRRARPGPARPGGQISRHPVIQGFDFPASRDRMKVFTRKRPARVIPTLAQIR
jgi:hypothetical protein